MNSLPNAEQLPLETFKALRVLRDILAWHSAKGETYIMQLLGNIFFNHFEIDSDDAWELPNKALLDILEKYAEDKNIQI